MGGQDIDKRSGEGLPPRSVRRRPAAEPGKTVSPTATARAEVAATTSPRARRWGRGLAVGLACLGVLGLGVYFGLPALLAPRTPIKVDDSPPAVQERDQRVSEFQQKIDTARVSLGKDPKAAVQVEVSSAEANAYLQKTVSKMSKDGAVYATAAQVEFKPQAVTGDVNLMVAGKPVGVHLDLKPEVREQTIILTVVDAAVGGIPWPASLGPLGGAIKDSLPPGVTFDPSQKSFVIDPRKLPFDLKQLQLEAGKLIATIGDKGK
ncbi:MAG: hypothetical protein ACYC9Q_01290 [Bacillota bacterium]